MPATPLIARTALSTRLFKSADLTEPTIVTLPFSTRVLTSSFESRGSAEIAASMRDWIVASSTGAVFSAGVNEGDGEGLFDGVGEVVGEGFELGDATGPAGIVCCGASEAVFRSNGRLVMMSARKVASAAATMMLMAIHGSGLLGGRLRREAGADSRREVSTTMRLFGDREFGTWSVRYVEIISYTPFDARFIRKEIH